jgi:superfamily II DNA/RNA helicase
MSPSPSLFAAVAVAVAAVCLCAVWFVCVSDPAADVLAFKSSGGHILIGTPGRLDDVMKRLGGALDTKQLEVLVSRIWGWAPTDSQQMCY